MVENARNMVIKSQYFTSRDGLKLHARDYQPTVQTHALPVICLPGLSRNARDFDLLAKTLAGDAKTPRRVVSFDYRGRGQSEYDPDWQNYNIITEAEDVVSGLTALGIEHGVFVGTSRGGLICFVLAGMRPGAMKAVVLNDIGPVIEGDGLMQIRTYLQKAPKPKTWPDAVETQKTIMGKNFPSFGPDEWEFEAQARYTNLDGIIKADYDPKLVNTMKALDAGSRLPTAWPQFMGLTRIPMLVIRGENSNILSAKTTTIMNDLHPQMDLMTIEGQGHAPMMHTADIPARVAELAAKVD